MMAIFSWATYFAYVGLKVQDGTFKYYYIQESTLFNPFWMTLIIIFTAFYMIAIIICFYAYREFKGMLFDYQGGNGGFLPNLNRN